jgi:hypothetical protein
MKEVVELNIVITRLESAIVSLRSSGLTFFSLIMFSREEKIATDRLLVSDEAVRVLNSRE